MQPSPITATALASGEPSTSVPAGVWADGAATGTRTRRFDSSENSSNTKCLFSPPMPKAFTPARRGLPGRGSGHGSGANGT